MKLSLVKLNIFIYRPHREKERRVKKVFMLRFWDLHFQTLKELDGVVGGWALFFLLSDLDFFLLLLLLFKQPDRTPSHGLTRPDCR